MFPPKSDAACDFCDKRQHLFRLMLAYVIWLRGISEVAAGHFS